MTWITDNLGISAELQGKILASVVVLIVLITVRILILRSIHQRVDDSEATYRTSKLTSYSVTLIGLITLSWIWIDAFENVATYLGLVSAGIAIALSDVLKNMAGWFYLLTRRPFKVGDLSKATWSISDSSGSR
jgi:small-conductance mechanosensitive channel